MPVKTTLRALWWIPNALSAYRGFVAAPIVAVVFLWEFFGHVSKTAIAPTALGNYPMWTCWLVVAAAVSDWLDGLLARTFQSFGWKTRNGGAFEAYCDKFFGIATLYLAIPLHYELGWYLVGYLPALAVIARYSLTTTRMRHERLIRKPNRTAQWKTAVLHGIAVAGAFDIAYLDSDVVLWGCVIAAVVAAVMCLYALEEYKEMALKPEAAE